MSEKLTIIVTSSFIPSHPCIKIIKQTIESLEKIKTNKNNCLMDTPIIIAQDHLKNSNTNEDKIKYDNYLKNSEDYSKEAISLPIYNDLTLKDQKKIVNTLKYIILKNKKNG